MIRHQAIGGDPYPGLGIGLGQNLLEGDVVRRLLKQREPPDTTVQDMIRKISSGKAGAAGHTALVSIPETRVKKRLPTPFIDPPCECRSPFPTDAWRNSGTEKGTGYFSIPLIVVWPLEK